MTNVRKVVDSNILQQFKAMQSDLLRLGTVITMSYSSLVQIVVIAGQADIARQELLHFSEGAAKMGVNFDMNSIQAGTAMISMREIFGLNPHGAVTLGDTITTCPTTWVLPQLASSILDNKPGHRPFNRDDRAAVRSLKLYLAGA
jgi:TP901 family phage tail tape measure protein